MSNHSFQTRTDPAPLFAELGDPTRLSLVTKLSDGQTRSIASLAADTSLTRHAVTKHLRVLENVGLVRSERIGRESQFAFRHEAIVEVRNYLDVVSQQWDAALSRLRFLVENDRNDHNDGGSA
jgi:DNA-binding transcriptional ArsR family regulator